MRTELKVSGRTHFSLGSRKSEVTEKVSKAARGEGAGVHLEQGERDATAKACWGGGYSHGWHRGPARAAVALVAVGMLHRPVQLFPYGAG